MNPFKVGDIVTAVTKNCRKDVNGYCTYPYGHEFEIGQSFRVAVIGGRHNAAFVYVEDGRGFLWDVFKKHVIDDFEETGVE